MDWLTHTDIYYFNGVNKPVTATLPTTNLVEKAFSDTDELGRECRPQTGGTFHSKHGSNSPVVRIQGICGTRRNTFPLI